MSYIITQEMYDKYFNAKIIDKGLKSDEYTSADWDSFLFRICNLTNPNRRLDVLELDKIWKMIDLKNIVAKQLPRMPRNYIVRLTMDR